MVELAIHNGLDAIYVTDQVDGVPCIHLGIQHDSADIETSLSGMLTEDQIQSAQRLISDDSVERSFTTRADYVVVRYN
jgi:hypothetical protein